MRKLFIINDVSGTAAQYGIGTFIQELSDSLQRTNCQIVKVDVNTDSFNIGICEKEKNVHWCLPKTKIKWDSDNYHYYRNIAYLLAASVNEGDEVAFQFNYLQHWIISCILRKLLPTARQILTIHYLDKEVKEKKDIFFQSVDAVVTLCEDTYHSVCDTSDVMAEKVFRIVNGIKDRYAILGYQQRVSLRKKYGFSETDKLILFVGRVCEQKGVGILLEATKQIIDNDKNVHLLLAGSGNIISYRKTSIGYWKNILFLGQLERETIFELYQIADVGAFPSSFEQFGYVAIEMMMFGLPVVAFAESGGLKDIFQWENVYQYTVPVNNISLLTQKLEWALKRNKKDSKIFRECYLNHYQNEKLNEYQYLYFRN